MDRINMKRRVLALPSTIPAEDGDINTNTQKGMSETSMFRNWEKVCISMQCEVMHDIPMPSSMPSFALAHCYILLCPHSCISPLTIDK